MGERIPVMRLGLLAILLAATALGQPVQGDVKSVGFEAATQTRYVIREGAWIPILGIYDKPGTEHFQGRLSVDFTDLDADRVEYIESPVTITAGGDKKRIWSYACTPYVSATSDVKVEIYDEKGIPMPRGTGMEKTAELIGADTLMVLDISDSAVSWPTGFDSGANNYLTMNWGLRTYYRPICVARLPAKNLPDRWFGLEACDVVVWDDPNPDEPSIDQVAALIQWVKNGGQLVVGVGPAWSKINKSPLAAIMPIGGDQPPLPTTQLNMFLTNLTNREEGFKSAVVLAPSELAPGALASVVDILPDGKVTNLVSIRHVGSGRVIATAARLRDLMAGGMVKREFYNTLLDLNANTAKFNTNEGQSQELRLRASAALHAPLLEPIEFRRTAGLLLFGAFAFVAIYIILSTFVAWVWMRKQSLTQLAWSVFAGFAVVASVASLGAVSTLQGCSDRVASISFIDMEASSPQARGHVAFGYKRTVRENVDVSLPGDGNYLRPLTPGDGIPGSYATPARYQAQSEKSALLGVPMRATLKQFEGFWSGEVDGAIRANLTVDRATGRVTPESWIQNDLNQDLLGGYLLYIDPRLQDPIRSDGVPYRVAGMDVRWKDASGKAIKWLGSEKVPPATNVVAVRFGPLKPQTKLTNLGAGTDPNEYGDIDANYGKWLNGNKDPRAEPVLPTLWWHQVHDWADGVYGTILRYRGAAMDANWSAALLASTRNLYLHTKKDNDFDQVGGPITTDGLPNVDITHWLTRGTAVLLLLSDKPSPATLHVFDRPVPTGEGKTLYRVRVPVTYTGTPPKPTAGTPGAPDKLPGEAP